MNKKNPEKNIKIIVILLITSLIIAASSLIIYTKVKKEREEEPNIKMETFDIHYMDSDYNELILTSIEIDENKSIMEKLETICRKVSSELFQDRKIKVLKIENNIAYIDLKDTNENDKWYDTFQGSTGGICTSYTLLANFLQESYTGKWIDGVYLTYNGETPEMDHMEDKFFGTIIYRQSNNQD